MERERKLLLAKIAVAVGAIPFVLWAHEYGPDAGYSGVPKEQGTCATSGCHVGTANNPANKGSVSVTFPMGLAYLPGVKQHLVVTVADPATTQKAWGFQLTARPSSNSATLAGTFDSTDPDTLLMCAGSNLFTEQDIAYSATKPQTCPSSMPLQYIEHSLTGYNNSLGKTGSHTYDFDWTPPATNVGNIVIYVAGNAANGDLGTGGDHIYTNSFTLTPCSGGSKPAITQNGVVNGASFQPGIVPDSWVTIQGTNLANTTTTWDTAILNGHLPASIGCSSVSIGGKPAYVYFVSPTQINVQAPDVGQGPLQVQVTNAAGTSDAATATSQQFGPAFFLWTGKYAVATRQDFSLAAKANLFQGLTTVPAKPGDIIILWGTGFGPTMPAVAAGIQTPSDKSYLVTPNPTITIGNTGAQVFGAALAPGFAGLYQVAIQVPNSTPDGDIPIKASIGSFQSPDGVFITVQH
jgi:uncharacterized protein (TIGR03437 family)